MLKAKCIQKFRDKNNNIICYRLQDCNGYTKDVTPDQLKIAIKNGQITIINLTLTSDNRLVDTTQTQQTQQKPQAQQISDEEQKIKNLIAKAKLLGLLKEIPTDCGHKCYLISQSPTQHLIYIPDDVNTLNEYSGRLVFTKYIKDLQGTLKVVGGKNLQDARYMFEGCQAQCIDISKLDTSNVTNMICMFAHCKAQSIDLRSFDTSNVTNMRSMFCDCQAISMNFRNFNTSKVTSMANMFYKCKDLSLDLSNFDTSNVTNMDSMFAHCQAQSIDLSSFDTSNVTNMHEMFCECQAKSLDLRSFNTSKVTAMFGIFNDCEAQIKATDNKILEYIK